MMSDENLECPICGWECFNLFIEENPDTDNDPETIDNDYIYRKEGICPYCHSEITVTYGLKHYVMDFDSVKIVLTESNLPPTI